MLFFTFGVANVYRIGFIAELIGRANTAIQAAKSLCGSKFFSKSDLIPISVFSLCSFRFDVFLCKRDCFDGNNEISFYDWLPSTWP